MIIEIKVPSAGESVSQVELARWLTEDGTYVEKDQEIAEIDSDKATLTINANEAGKIQHVVPEGTTVEPEQVIGKIDTEALPDKKTEKEPASEPESKEPVSTQAEKEQKEKVNQQKPDKEEKQEFIFSPQAKKLLNELELSREEFIENPDNKRITKKDILTAIAASVSEQKNPPHSLDRSPGASEKDREASREENTQKMSTLRRKVAERLVAVKNQTAMLTTFNEVDMSSIINLRKKYQEAFTEKYEIKLGFMSFFAKAVTQSIRYFPSINGFIENENIVIPSYVDLGIAVSTPKGLMVPIIKNAESMSIPELEHKISSLAIKARDNKISMDDLSGGTFSITNGGVFGSMLSTPILNPPQSAILGMHNITERPVAINGKIEIRPVMYLALSYDHRIIDGRESVGFLVKVKELIENPLKMITQGEDPGSLLLDI